MISTHKKCGYSIDTGGQNNFLVTIRAEWGVTPQLTGSRESRIVLKKNLPDTR